MKHVTLVVLTAAAILAACGSAGAQVWGQPSMPRAGACFYENPNFGGQYFCVKSGVDAPTVPPETNDRISSIRVFGYVEVLVYKDGEYRGASKRFDYNVEDLRQEGFNDQISSYRVLARGASQGTGWFGGGAYGAGSGGGDWSGAWGHGSVPHSGVCFYEHPNFGGESFCASTGANSKTVPPGANDKISSLRVFGNAQVTVYHDGGFQGASRQFDTDVNDLGRMGWGDRISSYRVSTRSSGGGWGGAYGAGGGYDAHRDQPQNSRWTYQQAEGMVRQSYRTVLGREPDPASASWISAVMKNNWSQAQLDAELMKTPEYREKIRR